VSYVLFSPDYDFSCISEIEIGFYYIAGNNKLELEYLIDGGNWTNIWNNTNSNSWTYENVNLNGLSGNDKVQLRFIASSESSIDNIKIGPPGSTIKLTYSYDNAGNRIGSNLIISLQESESLENRMDESGSNFKNFYN